MAEQVRLSPKTVGDNWSVYVLVDPESDLDMTDWDPSETRAQLRTAAGQLLASSNPDDVTGAVLLISFEGDPEIGLPATDFQSGVLSMLIVGDTAALPAGNPVYLQVSTKAPSLMGGQTVATYWWSAESQIEVND